MTRSIIALLMLLLLQVSVVSAEEPKAAASKAKSESAAAPTVTDVRRIDCSGNDSRFAGLGHAIRVKTENLKMFVEAAKSHGKKIHLFMDGKEIKGIIPDGGLYGDNKDELQFRLLRREALPADISDPQQKAVWASLFGFQDNLHWTHLVTVSVGEEGDMPIPSNAQLNLIRIRTVWAFSYAVIIALFVLLYIWAYKKGTFSDRGDHNCGNTAQKSKPPALSLARVQMGFWFFLVVSSFFFIWIVIGELPEIPPSILALIGIASGTALGAAAIDTNKRSGAKTELLKLQSELLAKSRNKDAAALRQNIRETETQKNAVSSCGSPIYDLLSDANGISFHRLQMAIWTLVLGIVFVVKVAINLSMPEFDMTLLALMGISSGTYLGFKFPEQQQKC
jgi:hypothetical protein